MDLNELCDRYFGPMRSAKPKQLEALHFVKNFPQTKRDMIVSLPVGYGKSCIFHLTPYLLNGIVFVVSPLNLIHKDQLETLASHNIPACRIDVNGHVFTIEGEVGMEGVCQGDYHVILVHPESLLKIDLTDQRIVDKVVAIFIDECHIVDEWSKDFRKAFEVIKLLPATFVKAMFIAMSGSLAQDQLKTLPGLLGLSDDTVIVIENPDKPNTYLSRVVKSSVSDCDDIDGVYEQIYKPVIDELYNDTVNFPVTLMFMNLRYMSNAMFYLQQLFGRQTIHSSCYSCLFSSQDSETINETIKELKNENPRIRLVLTTSAAGMGFDPQNVTRIIHCNPPRNIAKYLQEIGRAGRHNQKSEAILYVDCNDLRANLPGLKQDIIDYCRDVRCMRLCLLKAFGFSKNHLSPNGCMCCDMCKSKCTCISCA